MELTLACRIFIAAAIVFGGGLIIGAFISVMYQCRGIDRGLGRCQGLNWLAFFVGSTEQLSAILLIVFAPQYIAPFIGGWTGLKYAAGWQPGRTRRIREKSLLAFVGTVWSFGFGIAAGCIINPEALIHFRLAAYGH